jgi:hypothetical protein
MSQYYLLQTRRDALLFELYALQITAPMVGPAGPDHPVGPNWWARRPHGLCVHALFPLPDPWCVPVCPTNMQAPQRRHCLCGAVPLRRVQELHLGLSLGRAPMAAPDRQGQVITAWTAFTRAETGLCEQGSPTASTSGPPVGHQPPGTLGQGRGGMDTGQRSIGLTIAEQPYEISILPRVWAP